jgi:hypothetical protein
MVAAPTAMAAACRAPWAFGDGKKLEFNQKNGGLSSRTWDSCGETEGKSLGFN